MTSSRLPGKVLMPVAGVPMLGMMIERLSAAQSVAAICVATTTNVEDDAVEELAHDLGVHCFRGSESDVLGRVLGAARSIDADVIVEMTGDCPMADPDLVDACVAVYFASDVHYCANLSHPGLPSGLDVQVFSTALLAEIDAATIDPLDREHVTLFINERPEEFVRSHVPAPATLMRPSWRWTVDTEDDLQFVRRVATALGHRFRTREAIAWLDDHPEVIATNAHVSQKAVR